VVDHNPNTIESVVPLLSLSALNVLTFNTLSSVIETSSESGLLHFIHEH